MRNCEPAQANPMRRPLTPVVGGFYLEPRPAARNAEANLAGVYATVIAKDSGHEHEGILWGYVHDESTTWHMPWVEDFGGQPWAIELRHTRYRMPFAVHLDDFIHELHPGTQMDKNFQSDVHKITAELEEPVSIRMNEPLRDGDYVLFQSKYGSSRVRAGSPPFSVFAVVRNPSDQWPLWACVIIFIGLALHFTMKLVRFILSEQRRAQMRSAASSTAVAATPLLACLLVTSCAQRPKWDGPVVRDHTWSQEVIDTVSRIPVQA